MTSRTAFWPTLAWESLDWTSHLPDDAVSRAVRARHIGPYRAAITPAIADLDPGIPSAVAGLVTEATSVMTRFDAEVGAELAPFASVLLRSESASSSQIEHLTSSAKSIALAELGSTDKQNATLIVANVRAMRAALDLADSLDAQAVLEMHKALMSGVDTEAGRWRTEQVWIGGHGYGPHEAAFVPPHHSRVPGAMKDLLDFMCRYDLPALVHAAVAHAQFETIHPFTDGNGRTGRALIHSMLHGAGVAARVTVPVSAGLLANTSAYFDALTTYRQGDPVPIIEQVAEASLLAVVNGRQLIAELKQIRSSWDDRIKARRDATAWRLADLLLRQPVVDAVTVADQLGVRPENAWRPVEPLLAAGVLTEFTGFKRNRMWQASEVLTALDDFAKRSGRRG